MDVQVVKTTGRLYEISFYKYFSTDLGWVRVLVLLDGTPVFGPNLKMECHCNKKEEPFDPDTQLKKNCRVLGDGRFFLSCVCNWRFTNIIGAFEGVAGTRSRSLFVYSYVGGSSVVGETKFTDLLGEVYFRRQGERYQYFEPLHIQYIVLRKQVLDITETQLSGSDSR